MYSTLLQILVYILAYIFSVVTQNSFRRKVKVLLNVRSPLLLGEMMENIHFDVAGE